LFSCFSGHFYNTIHVSKCYTSLTISVNKRKAVEQLCERPRNIIHSEISPNDLNILDTKDINLIRKNIHTDRIVRIRNCICDVTRRSIDILQTCKGGENGLLTLILI